jgi:hypothetical protein
MRNDARKGIEPPFVEAAGNLMKQDCMQTRIGKNDFQTALGGRIFALNGLNVFAQRHALFLYDDARQPQDTEIGKLLNRLPVAAKSAFATAGAMGGTLASPTPPGSSSLFTM